MAKTSEGARRLAEWRKGRKLTLDALAGRVGASKGLVWCWEQGTKRPGLEHAMTLRRVARIPLRSWL